MAGAGEKGGRGEKRGRGLGVGGQSIADGRPGVGKGGRLQRREPSYSRGRPRVFWAVPSQPAGAPCLRGFGLVGRTESWRKREGLEAKRERRFREASPFYKAMRGSIATRGHHHLPPPLPGRTVEIRENESQGDSARGKRKIIDTDPHRNMLTSHPHWGKRYAQRAEEPSPTRHPTGQ